MDSVDQRVLILTKTRFLNVTDAEMENGLNETRNRNMSLTPRPKHFLVVTNLGRSKS